MTRPGRNGDPSEPVGFEPVFGRGLRDLTPEEVEQLAGVLVQAGQRVRNGEAGEVEMRAVEGAGRELQIDLAAAAGWSPSLVLSALLIQPAAPRSVAAVWFECGLDGKRE
jgi:hypothetical protein